MRNTFTHDARVLRAAQTLSERGFAPLVVAVMSTEVQWRAEVKDGIPVLRLDPSSPFSWLRARIGRRRGRSEPAGGSPSPANGSGPPRAAVRLHRWFRTIDFYRRAFGVVRRERPVLLHCNDYNTMWVGVLARARGRTAVVYDSHELWPDRNLRPEPRWWLLICEALFVRAAHTVVVASPGYADVMARRYRIPRPAVVRNVPRARPLLTGPAVVSLDTAVYVGGLLPHRGLESAIEALALLPGLRLRLIGPGAPEYMQALRAHAERHDVAGRVEFTGTVEPRQVVDIIGGAAFGLALFQPVCLSHLLVAPNKLFEYLAAEVPVLASDLPVMRAFIDEWRVGLTAPANDVERIMHAARELLDPRANARFRLAAASAASAVTWANEEKILDAAYGRALAVNAPPLRNR